MQSPYVSKIFMAVAANVFLDQMNSKWKNWALESLSARFEIYLGKFKSSVSIHFINGDKNACFTVLSWGSVLLWCHVYKSSGKMPHRGTI